MLLSLDKQDDDDLQPTVTVTVDSEASNDSISLRSGSIALNTT